MKATPDSDSGLAASWPASDAAEEAYVEFLERRSAGEELAFEAFCRERPEHAEALRAIHALSSALDSELGTDAPAPDHDVPDDPRFEVRGELGRGGMGVVYEVFDNDLGRVLAMKVVRSDAGVQGTAARRAVLRRLSRFVEEAEITGRLSHPGIVPIHERGVDAEGRVFFTMPRIEGESFEELLVRGGGRARALEVLLRVCDTMAFAHDRGVLHRDLKPSNVMVGRFGEAYVMDWGLARVLGREDERDLRLADGSEVGESGLMTMEGDVVGTPAYMSPEQAAGEIDRLGPASDVYSAGALLYRLLAGHAPYAEDGASPPAARILERLRAGPPQALTERPLPPELVAIAAKAMERDPARRYANMSALASDLRAYLEGRVVGAYESGGLAELRKWIGRNRALAGAIGAAVAIAFAGALLSLRQQSARQREERLAADRYRLEAYLEELDELWPLRPELIPRLEGWLRDARELAERRPQHDARLARLLGSGRESTTERAKLLAFRDALDGLEAPDGAIAEVERRLAFAGSVRARTVESYAAEWDDAARWCADWYAGMLLTPQVGLIPLGPDPRSGLLEFAHLASGAPAVRGADGELVRDAETGLVLVLIPGGTRRIGAMRPGEGEENGHAHRDTLALDREGPVFEVELEPYFLSKYEMTRSQWLRATGAETASFAARVQPQPLWPVQEVSWNDATRVLRQLGLTLPTEAQWEAAARGGVGGAPWYWGPDASSLRERLHVEATSPTEVGLREPNAYGLHDVLDNVAEWCRDVFDIYGDVTDFVDAEVEELDEGRWPLAPGDGERLARGKHRTWRGGHFWLTREAVTLIARVSFRMDEFPSAAADVHGVRPARPLDR
ncbi:MAG: SUMF1/EgtB/PvdO family nonheme iron enzyme [Planctomycetota bacterium]